MDFESRRTVRVYVSAVLFLFLNVKTAMFFLCTVERYSIMKPVFLHKFKSCNKEIGKPDESLGRKAIGPLKWQPVAGNDVHCLFDSAFFHDNRMLAERAFYC